MGEVELNFNSNEIIINSHIITYGSAASEMLSEQLREEIESMWNEPKASIKLKDTLFKVVFKITASYQPAITPIDIYKDVNPRNNFFRIEEHVKGNISFVDGLGSNSGYFLLENLYKGSTTAAHEYGHTLGLDHPKNLDIRGKGVPGIMYPRGTLVDPPFQYDPSIPAGKKGGTMHPIHRRVKPEDIEELKLPRLEFKNQKAIIGYFTNIYHPNHSETGGEEFIIPPIVG